MHSKSLSGRKYNHGPGLYQGVIIKRLDSNSYFLGEILGNLWEFIIKTDNCYCNILKDGVN